MSVSEIIVGERTDAAAIAATLVDARHRAIALPAYPGALPPTLAAGYAIQDAGLALAGGVVAGWKVGRIWPPNEGNYGSNRLAGPIFASVVVAAGKAPLAMPVFEGGFGAVEAEFIFKLGAIDPAKTSYSLGEAAASVAAVHVGIEIASSPLPMINDLGPAVTVSDFGNNNGLIVGAEVTDWQTRDIDNWPIRVTIDGAEIGTGVARDFPDGNLGAVRFLLELLAARGIAVPAGTLISAGAITGVHPIAIGQGATAYFGHFGSVDCTIVKARPVAA